MKKIFYKRKKNKNVYSIKFFFGTLTSIFICFAIFSYLGVIKLSNENFFILLITLILSFFYLSKYKVKSADKMSKFKYIYFIVQSCFFYFIIIIVWKWLFLEIEADDSFVLQSFLLTFTIAVYIISSIMLSNFESFDINDNKFHNMNIILRKPRLCVYRIRRWKLLCKMDYRYRHVILTMIFLFWLSNSGVKNAIGMFIGSLFYAFAIILFCIPANKIFNVKVNTINIGLKNLKKHNIYMASEKSIKEDFKIIEINIASLFPDGACNRGYHLDNYQCVEGIEEGNIEKFYFMVPLKMHANFYDIDIVYYYEVDDRKYFNKLTIYLEIDEVNNELFPIIRLYDNYISLKDRECYKKGNRRIVENLVCNLEYGFSSAYYYDLEKMDDDIFDLELTDKRKFLIHDGEYGIGKTTFDLNYINNNGYLPVIISPWESNYDHDILYLIFSRIKKVTNTTVHEFNKSMSIFYFTLLFSVETIVFASYNDLNTFFYPLLVIIENVMSLILDNPLIDTGILVWITNKYFIILVLIPMLLYIIYIRSIADIIIFKKDYSKVYQDFFISEIKNMLVNHGKIILLIEDIDRLSPESMNSTFRTISAINQEMSKSNIIGVLSYSIRNFNKKNEGIIGCSSDDLKNKIIFQEIEFDYKSSDSVRLYLSNVFGYIKMEKCLQIDINSAIDDIIISTIETGEANFRDIKVLIYNLVQQYDDLTNDSFNKEINKFKKSMS